MFDALIAHETTIDNAQATAKAEDFSRHLIERFDLESESDSDQRQLEAEDNSPQRPLTPLDKSLSNAIQEFKQSMPGLKLTRPSVLINPLLLTIEAKAQSICCSTCSPVSRICEGVSDAEDDEIVFAAGKCVAQLHNLFQVVEEATLEYYKKYGSFSLTQNWPSVVFSTANFRNSLTAHGTSPDQAVGGVTQFYNSITTAEVQLQMAVSRFDLTAYNSIPYILFHECVAHIFYGIHPDPKTRPASIKPYDRFVEGWMDWIALKVYGEILNSTGFSGARWTADLTAPDRLELAGSLHLRRINSPNSKKGAGQVRLGARIAEVTYKFIQQLYKDEILGPPDESWSAFCQLSFDINMLADLTEADRNSFIRCMSHLRFPPEIDGSRFDVETILINYLHTKDLRKLLKETLSF